MIRYRDLETIEYVHEKASRLSGMDSFPASEMPPIFRASSRVISAIVCPEDPENCHNLAAVFDDVGYRILIRDDFDFRQDLDLSFLIHETVHALQYRLRGAEIIRDCQALFETEREAYAVQDLYLKKQGQFFRAGGFLRFFGCNEEQTRQDYEKSLAVWKQRNVTGRFVLP